MRQLIGEKWSQYVEENKDKLEAIESSKENIFKVLSELDIYRFQFEIHEAYPEVDAGLDNFFSFHLSYLIKEPIEVFPKDKITISVSPDFMAVVILDTKETETIEEKTVEFKDYFGVGEEESAELDEFFSVYANLVLAK